MKSPRTESPANPKESPRPHFVSDAFATARRRFCELREYVNFYLIAQLDRIKFSVKRLVLYAALAMLALVAGAALMVTAAVQICYGISHLLTIAFGGRIWLGELVTGLIIWIVIMSVTYVVISSLLEKSRKATMEKYEKRRQQQRSDFGHDVRQPGANHGK